MKINATTGEIKTIALFMLRGRWGKAILLSLFYILFSAVVTALSVTLSEQQMLLLILTALFTFVECFLDLGVRYGMLQCSRGVTPSVGCIFDGGKCYLKGLLFYLPLQVLSYGFSNSAMYLAEHPENPWFIAVVLGLGALQLWFQLSFMPMLYLIMDNPGMKVGKLLGTAFQMMRRNRVKFLLLHLSFFGWMLLVMMFFGLGMLFLLPYMYVAECVFYQHLLLTEQEVSQPDTENE